MERKTAFKRKNNRIKTKRRRRELQLVGRKKKSVHSGENMSGNRENGGR